MTQIAKLGKVGLHCAEFSLSEVNCLTKNKNEAMGAKTISGLRFEPVMGGVPKWI